MRLHCPLLVDEDEVCNQPISLTVDPGQRPMLDDPGCPPSISGASGPCPHVRMLNHGDLPASDEEALLQAAMERSEELYEEALEARVDRLIEEERGLA